MITNGKMKKKLSFRSSIHHLLLSTENLAITAFCFRSFLNAVREIYLYRTEITAWDFQKSSKGVQQFSCFYYTNNTKLQNIPVEHFFPERNKNSNYLCFLPNRIFRISFKRISGARLLHS